MSETGLENELSTVTDDGLERVTIGQIVSIESNGPHGYLLNCLTRPDGLEVQARPAASGIWVPYNVDDEVELTFPNGDPNRAIARRGLTSTPDPIPADFNNSQPVFTHGQGLEVRTSDGATVSGVVVSDQYLADLKDMVADLAAFAAAVAAAAGVPATPVTTGALFGFIGGPTGLLVSAVTLQTKLTTSIAAGPGPPYAAKALKTE